MMRVLLHLVLMCAVLATSIGTAAARGSAPAMDQMVICSGQDVFVVYVDENGDPTHASHLCPDCVLHVLAPVSGSVAFGAHLSPCRIALGYRIASQNVHPRPSSITARGPPTTLI